MLVLFSELISFVSRDISINGFYIWSVILFLFRMETDSPVKLVCVTTKASAPETPLVPLMK